MLAPACVTLNTCPAIVTSPLRCVAAVLAATDIDTVPAPLPVPPPVTVIHAALLLAVHAHPVPAVTAALVVAPAAGALNESGDTAKLHPVCAGCVTVSVRPAILTMPVLVELVLFPKTRTATVPLPMPELPPVTISHVTVLAAPQMQLPPAVTATLIDSPVDAAVRVSGAMVLEQEPDAGCVMVKV